MSKIFDATCTADSVVKVQGQAVNATILSEGKKASTGIVALQGSTATYITSNASDVKLLIENINTLVGKIADVVDQVVLALSALDGVTTTPGSAAAAIALVATKELLVVTAKTTLNAQKDVLK